VVVYDALADLVVTIHAAYVGFVVFGFTAIVLGSAMGWRWVRNLYFRVAHLAAILLVCLEALIGVSCPLTTLENRLRVLGRGRPYAGTFVGHLLERLVFYSFPAVAFHDGLSVVRCGGAVDVHTSATAAWWLDEVASKMARAAIGSAAMNATASAGRTEPKVGIDGRRS
jgi:Protein of Unknown function (DUF2784)